MLICIGLFWIFAPLKQFLASDIFYLILLIPAAFGGYRSYRKFGLLFGTKADLKQGVVEVLTIEASRAIKVKELKFEEIGFYLDIGEGNVLFLQGQYLYEHDAKHQFPCTRFVLTRAMRTGKVFDLKCEGVYLPPVQTNLQFHIKEYIARRVPHDGQVLNVDFESLKKKVIV